MPRVHLAPHVLVDGGWIIPDYTAEAAIAEPPAEMHLRELCDVDLTDGAALAGLFATVGPLVDWARPAFGIVNPGTVSDWAERDYERMAADIGRDLELPEPVWRERGSGVHVSEVALRVAYIRLMTSHVIRAETDETTASLWQRAGLFEFPDGYLTAVGLQDLDSETMAWHLFSQCLNNGLAGVTPRVVLTGLPQLPEIGDITDAYTAACVLIFNDLIDSGPYLTCADETCGRIFRRQRGRSSGTYNRTDGVAYCTPQHARNQSQRERRRRARAERTEGGA